MLRYRGNRARARIGAARDRPEGLRNQRHELRRIGITHGNHGHEVRAIPVAPEAPHRRRVGRLDHRRQADRQPVSVARSTENHGKLLVANTLAGTKPRAPFRQHDPAFGDHLSRIEENARRHIAEKTETLLENTRAVGGYRQDVHGFVKTGLRIQISAETHADRLEVLHDVVFGERFRAVEGHVLEKVREAALIVVLENRACIHHQTQLGALLRLCIAAYVVSHAVGQRADPHPRVNR